MREQELNQISHQLELFARMHLGQYTRFYDILEETDGNIRFYDQKEFFERALKRIILPELEDPRSSYGIGSEMISEKAKIAWEMHSVIRHYFAWKHHPEGGYTVNFQTPIKTSLSESFLEIQESSGGNYILENLTDAKRNVMQLSKDFYESIKRKDASFFVNYIAETKQIPKEEVSYLMDTLLFN